MGATMWEWFINIVLLFFVFSMVGWCIEVTLKYREFHRFVNRGFLMGPCLPIYGSGAALVTMAVDAIAGFDSSIGTTFVVSFFVCGILEYMASYFMEKKFHARWWDYTCRPMNLNGRVWIGNLILFGIGGLIIVKVIDPVLFGFFDMFALWIKEIVACVLVVIFVADYTMSHIVMKLVKVGIESSEADNTEEIGKEIKLLLSDRNIFYRRFADAYPDVIFRTDKVKERMEMIRLETEKLKKEAELRIDELGKKLGEEKAALVTTLETSSSIKSTIIQKQDDLIALLYDENTATPQMQELLAEIDEKKDIIAGRSVRKIKISLPGGE